MDLVCVLREDEDLVNGPAAGAEGSITAFLP
jgi:hypothetical protein